MVSSSWVRTHDNRAGRVQRMLSSARAARHEAHLRAGTHWQPAERTTLAETFCPKVAELDLPPTV